MSEKSRKNKKGEGANKAEKTLKMWGIEFCGRDRDGVLSLLTKERKDQSYWVVTVNPEFVMKARKDRAFLNLINKSDLKVIDGVGIVWAKMVEKRGKESKSLRVVDAIEEGINVLKGEYQKEVTAGSRLMAEICRVAAKSGEKVFFLGGFADGAKKTGEEMAKRYKGLKYEYSEGMPKISDEKVIEKINKFKAEYLFVAYGMKKQEEWIWKNIKKLKVGVVMGVGRSFDYYSGKVKMAPDEWRKMGLEWLYSLIQDPKRWKRQLELPKFVWMVLNS